MSSLYHYCTVETLKCILNHKSLRLSDIRKSNDSKEIDFLFEQYRNWLKKSNNYNDYSIYLANLNEFDQKKQMENTVFLVSCFSKKQDDLHMWSCYGNKGICIEFDRNLLEEHIKKIRVGVSEDFLNKNITVMSEVLELKEVDYYDESTISSYFSNKKFNNSNDFFNIFKESPTIKSSFFKSEEEVRLIYTHMGGINIQNNLSYVNDFGKVEKLVKFKSISNEIYQHKMVFDMPLIMNIIKSITIGPNSTLTVQDLEQLLFINDIKDIDVKVSLGSYR